VVGLVCPHSLLPWGFGHQRALTHHKRLFHQEDSFLLQNRSVTVQEAVCIFILAITYLQDIVASGCIEHVMVSQWSLQNGSLYVLPYSHYRDSESRGT
jgi:hypothetical protein